MVFVQRNQTQINQTHHTILCSVRFTFFLRWDIGFNSHSGHIYLPEYFFYLCCPLRWADNLSKESCCVLFVRIKFQANRRPWAALASSAAEQKPKNSVAFTLSVPFNDTVSSSDYIAWW